ncbi:MAG: agmatinase [Calditrichia bacterium]
MQNDIKISHRSQFAYATSNLDEAKIVMFGVPYDFTSSNRAGSRFGPPAFRLESYTGMEEYSPYFDVDISQLKIHDAGDLELETGNKDLCLDQAYRFTSELLKSNKIPVVLGGEHLISYPVIKAVSEQYPNLRIIHLDAHTDVIDNLYGSSLSHGTVMRRVYELFNENGRIYQFGVRSGSREEFQWSREHNIMFPFSLNKGIPALEELKPFPVYITIDLDVFDPSLISGTGTPEAGGIFFQEFMDFLLAIKKNNLNIVGADIVELAPELDTSKVSSTVAAKILRELLCVLE